MQISVFVSGLLGSPEPPYSLFPLAHFPRPVIYKTPLHALHPLLLCQLNEFLLYENVRLFVCTVKLESTNFISLFFECAHSLQKQQQQEQQQNEQQQQQQK